MVPRYGLFGYHRGRCWEPSGKCRFTALGGQDDPVTAEAAEGAVITRLHQSRERNARLVQAKKSAVSGNPVGWCVRRAALTLRSGTGIGGVASPNATTSSPSAACRQMTEPGSRIWQSFAPTATEWFTQGRPGCQLNK
jgi:hypothetical protein